MKNIEVEIKGKFIELLQTRSIDEIDVQLIAKQLKITRQTFYYHYKNVYDLISSIVIEHQVPLTENETLDELIDKILDEYLNHLEFYKEILNSSAKDIIEETTYSYFYKGLNSYLRKDERVNLDSRKDIVSFISYGISKTFLNNFLQGNYSIEDLKIKLKCFINDKTLNSVVEGYLNNI